jgi:hypothetical protein
MSPDSRFPAGLMALVYNDKRLELDKNPQLMTNNLDNDKLSIRRKKVMPIVL